MPAAFDPYSDWLGVAPGRRPPNYYALLGVSESAGALLGVSESAGPAEIKNASEQACARLHIHTKGRKVKKVERAFC